MRLPGIDMVAKIFSTVAALDGHNGAFAPLVIQRPTNDQLGHPGGNASTARGRFFPLSHNTPG